jgi:tetratricopeptide (TPR) repeat protein
MSLFEYSSPKYDHDTDAHSESESDARSEPALDELPNTIFRREDEASCVEVQEAADQEEVARKLEESVARAEEIKAEGNKLYGEGRYEGALEKYNEAIATVNEFGTHPACAVYYANLAACFLKLPGKALEASSACSEAIELDPSYGKAYMRRAAALEQLDDLDHALTDAKKVLELEPGSSWAKQIIARLEPLVQEKHEKLKNEMFGKLKDLGNSILGRFGLSVDNFKAEKDPESGGYSIKFQQ